MKLTKLTIIQNALSALDLDNASFIGDTIESEQIAAIVDSVYDDMLGDQPWPNLRSFYPLEITSQENLMKLPDDVLTLNDVWYNKKKLQYILPQDMVELLMSRDETQSNVDDNGAITDKAPTYWSSYDDTYVVFDSYEGNLVSSYSKADVYRMPAQMTADTDYPDLPERFHQTLYHGVLADSFYTLKADVTGFNIWRNRFKKEKAVMDRWMRRVNRDMRENLIDYGRKWS